MTRWHQNCPWPGAADPPSGQPSPGNDHPPPGAPDQWDSRPRGHTHIPPEPQPHHKDPWAFHEWLEWLQHGFAQLESQQGQLSTVLRETDVKVDLVREQLEEKFKEMTDKSRREKFLASDAMNTARDCKDMLEMMQKQHAERLEQLERGLSSTISAADAAAIIEFKSAVQPMMMEMMGKVREGVSLIDQARADAANAHGELSAQVHALTAANAQLTARLDALSQTVEYVKLDIQDEKDRNKASVDGLGAMVLSVQEHMLQLKPSGKSSNSPPTASPLPVLQTFEKRISGLEKGRQHMAQELQTFKTTHDAAGNAMKAKVVELVERLTLVEDKSLDADAMAIKLKDMEKKLLEMHAAFQESTKTAQNNLSAAIKQQHDAMTTQATEQDARLQQVLHKVRGLLTGLQQQTLQDRESLASAVKTLKQDVAAISHGLQQCKTAITTAQSHPPPPQPQPVPVPSHTSHGPTP